MTLSFIPLAVRQVAVKAETRCSSSAPVTRGASAGLLRCRRSNRLHQAENYIRGVGCLRKAALGALNASVGCLGGLPQKCMKGVQRCSARCLERQLRGRRPSHTTAQKVRECEAALALYPVRKECQRPHSLSHLTAEKNPSYNIKRHKKGWRGKHSEAMRLGARSAAVRSHNPTPPVTRNIAASVGKKRAHKRARLLKSAMAAEFRRPCVANTSETTRAPEVAMSRPL